MTALRECQAGIDTAFDTSDWRAEREMRAEMFSEDPTCGYCRNPISEPYQAVALHYNDSGKWELVHVFRCSLTVVFNENRRRVGLPPL